MELEAASIFAIARDLIMKNRTLGQQVRARRHVEPFFVPLIEHRRTVKIIIVLGGRLDPIISGFYKPIRMTVDFSPRVTSPRSARLGKFPETVSRIEER